MKRGTFALLGSALALAACSDVQDPTGARPTPGAPLHAAAPGLGIDGSYIIVLKDGADARSVAAIAKANPDFVYTASFNGFAARLNQGQLNALQHNPNVEYVEEDAVVQNSATQSGATWGIDRTDQRALPLSGTYNYTTTASNVNAYVIDTGIYTSHAQFGGRATNVYDALGGNGQDCNAHGTHVAGTIGSSTYGLANAVRLRGVRVLNSQRSGRSAGVLAGIDWVRPNHVKPALANMSLGGGYSATENTAVTNLVNAGVFLAVAAGNENQNACNTSPASAAAVTTVAASDRTDTRASFSNYGSCVDIYAPGVSITSTWLNGGTNTISGTSMASPHVAGVAALYKATYGDASQSTINSWLVNNSTANVIKSNPTGTVNRLLFKGTL